MMSVDTYGLDHRKNQKLARQGVLGFGWTFSGTSAQAILQIVVLGVLARFLPPEAFGLVSAATTVIGFSLIFSLLGVGPAIVQRKDLGLHHLRAGLTISLLFGGLFTVILWLLAPLMALWFRAEALPNVLKVLSLVIVLQALAVIPDALLQRELCFKKLAKVQILSYAIGYSLVGISGAYLGLGVWALVAAHLAQNVVQTFLLTIMQPYPKLPLISIAATKELLWYGAGHTIARIGNYSASFGDRILIGHYMGPETLGIYTNAYQIMSWPAMFFGQIIDRLLFPILSKVGQNQSRLFVAYRRSITTVAFITVSLSLLMFELAPEIIRVLLGDRWDAAIVPFQILILGMLFRSGSKVSDSLARATGAVYRRAWRQWMYAMLIAIGILMGRFWGINGIVYGILLALLVNYLAMAHLSMRLIAMRWHEFLLCHGRPLLAGLGLWGMGMICAGVLRDLGAAAILVLFGACLAAALAVLGLLSIVPRAAIGQDLQWLLNLLLGFARKRGT